MTAFALALFLSSAPADFADDVRALHRVVGCLSDLPEQLPSKPLADYCDVQRPRFARFRDRWAPRARSFLDGVRPAGLPAELVYPFGGGDLMSALVAFPDAQVITTLSLELAGDPRRLARLDDAKTLGRSLTAIAQASQSTLMSNDSLSKNLSATQQGELPGQLSMHLMGLALFDLEPVSARYFRVEPDGSLHYYSAEEIAALDGTTATQLKGNWKPPDFSPAFANVEVQFVPRGQPDGPRRIHRHLAVNLHNDALPPGVLKHLEAKGRFAAMTKAASYLLWREGFSAVRDVLLSRAVFMVSDSTGIPPRHWTKRGCSVEAYGKFERSFLGTWEGYQAELRELFARARPLPMRFGYPDGSPGKHNHLLAARCPVAP
jgi:hypothetical protein